MFGYIGHMLLLDYILIGALYLQGRVEGVIDFYIKYGYDFLKVFRRTFKSVHKKVHL